MNIAIIVAVIIGSTVAIAVYNSKAGEDEDE